MYGWMDGLAVCLCLSVVDRMTGLCVVLMGALTLHLIWITRVIGPAFSPDDPAGAGVHSWEHDQVPHRPGHAEECPNVQAPVHQGSGRRSWKVRHDEGSGYVTLHTSTG